MTAHIWVNGALVDAAAAVVPVLVAFAGLRPDIPAGRVTVRPAGPLDLGELELRELRVGGEPFTVRVDRTGQAIVEEAGSGIQLRI